MLSALQGPESELQGARSAPMHWYVGLTNFYCHMLSLLAMQFPGCAHIMLHTLLTLAPEL